VPSELTLEVVTRDGVAVATFAGELDSADTESVRAKLLGALASPGHGLVCDLTSLSYIGSAGVHLLHRLGRSLHAEGRRMALVAPTAPTARRVLEITGITEEIPLFETVDQAATDVRST
jgi:anti-sigma B factor antagonist